tara:strand:+ start:602 stop:748 length:147 start_codon:yes stop_codon:yes gene_type:complete
MIKKRVKRKKFPDMSGDGRVTMKDVLIGRGVIKKNGGSKKGNRKKAKR